VLAAFGAAHAEVGQLPVGHGLAFRFGDIVLKSVTDTAEASWIAATFEQVRVNGIRVARPVRSSDGRWVVAGWSAQRFVSGRAEPRFNEIIETSFTLHQALEAVPQPRLLRERDTLCSWADRLAWGEPVGELWKIGDGHGPRLFQELVVGRRPVDLPDQVVHGDVFGNVLFAGVAPPAIINFTPFWRPVIWSAAVIAVDALSWGGAQTELLQQWSHLRCWPQMLLRALLFRLAVNLADPHSTPASLVEILSAAELIRPFLD